MHASPLRTASLRTAVSIAIAASCCALLACGQCLRALEPATEAPAAHGRESGKLTAAQVIARYEGVYKTRFPNSTVQNDKFESENILEIVPYGADKIYFRLHLEFYNAHLCDLYGIAAYQDGAFIFRDPSGASEDVCTLNIVLDNDNVKFDDAGGNCRAYYCGARGSFSGEGFPTKSRRPITYLKRLRASREYSEAVENFERSAKQPDPGSARPNQ